MKIAGFENKFMLAWVSSMMMFPLYSVARDTNTDIKVSGSLWTRRLSSVDGMESAIVVRNMSVSTDESAKCTIFVGHALYLWPFLPQVQQTMPTGLMELVGMGEATIAIFVALHKNRGVYQTSRCFRPGDKAVSSETAT